MADSPQIENPSNNEEQPVRPTAVPIPTSVLTPASPATPVSFTHALSIKLDDKNFLLWSQQIEGVIAAHKLHHFVVNPLIPLKYANEHDRDLDLSTEEYQRWLVQDQLLFTWLLSSLSESILPRVLGCKHSWEVWDKIHKYFYSHMKANVRQLRSELKSAKKGTRSMSEYLLQIKAIVDSLVAIGDPISEQDHIDVILDGLPEEYNPFVMMMYGRIDSPPIHDIEALLLVQEAQLEKYKQELNIGHVSVNVAQGRSNEHNQNDNRGRGANCGRGSRGRGNRGRGRGGPRPTCQLCYKYGHDAFHCWNRFDANFVPPTPPPDQNFGFTPNQQFQNAVASLLISSIRMHKALAQFNLQVPSSLLSSLVITL